MCCTPAGPDSTVLPHQLLPIPLHKKQLAQVDGGQHATLELALQLDVPAVGYSTAYVVLESGESLGRSLGWYHSTAGMQMSSARVALLTYLLLRPAGCAMCLQLESCAGALSFPTSLCGCRLTVQGLMRLSHPMPSARPSTTKAHSRTSSQTTDWICCWTAPVATSPALRPATTHGSCHTRSAWPLWRALAAEARIHAAQGAVLRWVLAARPKRWQSPCAH